MNLTNIKYLYDLMDKECFTFFTIYDSKGSTMRDQGNENYSLQDAKEDLQQFLEYNSGVFRVEFRRTKINNANTKNYSYTIDNLKIDQRDTPSSIGNVGADMDFMSIISAKDDKIERLQSEMFANMMAAMNKQHELQMEALTLSMKSKDGNNDALMSTALSAITGMFGNSSIGVSGLDQMEIPTENFNTKPNMLIDDKKQKINNAVVRLIKGDPDFADHIMKLADLCDSSPFIYKMAIAKLNEI